MDLYSDMKSIRLTKIECPLCSKPWRLTKVEYHGDKFLLCLHCDPRVRSRVIFGLDYDKNGEMVTLEPFSEVIEKFKSREEIHNKCLEVLEELH